MRITGNDPKFPKLPDGSRDLDHSWTHIQTWLEMEKLVKTGKVKAIGVSNYSKRYLISARRRAFISPHIVHWEARGAQCSRQSLLLRFRRGRALLLLRCF